MAGTEKEFPVFPDPPPGGFVEDPDFEFIDDEERELAESFLRGEWRPMSKQQIRDMFLERGFAPPPLDNVVEREKPTPNAAD